MTLEELQQMALANNPLCGKRKRASAPPQAERVKKVFGLIQPWGTWVKKFAGDRLVAGSKALSSQQNIILGGKLGLDRRIFSEEGKQAEAEAEEQRFVWRMGVRIAFYESLAAEQMVEMRRKLSALANDAVETTQQLFNVGQADQPDVLQAEVEADEADLAHCYPRNKSNSARGGPGRSCWQTRSFAGTFACQFRRSAATKSRPDSANNFKRTARP